MAPVDPPSTSKPGGHAGLNPDTTPLGPRVGRVHTATFAPSGGTTQSISGTDLRQVFMEAVMRLARPENIDHTPPSDPSTDRPEARAINPPPTYGQGSHFRLNPNAKPFVPRASDTNATTVMPSAGPSQPVSGTDHPSGDPHKTSRASQTTSEIGAEARSASGKYHRPKTGTERKSVSARAKTETSTSAVPLANLPSPFSRATGSRRPVARIKKADPDQTNESAPSSSKAAQRISARSFASTSSASQSRRSTESYSADASTDSQSPKSKPSWGIAYHNSKEIYRQINELPPSERKRFDHWCDLIAKEHLHPKTAAGIIGDTNYEKMKTTKNKFTIRLSQVSRVHFQFNTQTRDIELTSVGSHDE